MTDLLGEDLYSSVPPHTTTGTHTNKQTNKQINKHPSREAYLSVVVLTIDRNGGPESVQLIPVVNETDDLEVISPCEPPPPGTVVDIFSNMESL